MSKKINHQKYCLFTQSTSGQTCKIVNKQHSVNKYNVVSALKAVINVFQTQKYKKIINNCSMVTVYSNLSQSVFTTEDLFVETMPSFPLEIKV